MTNPNNYNTPFTPEALASLETAIIEGVQTVKYSDKEVTYRSLDEMMRIRDLMRSKLGLNAASGQGVFGGKQKIGRHNKGL